MSQKKMVSRNVAIALGIVCIILVAGLGGAMAYYTMTINNKDNELSTLKSYIATVTGGSSTSNATTLVAQLNATINIMKATLTGQINTMGSLIANVTNLINEKNQLQTWLAGNETLLSQTGTWLDDNITYCNSQIISLNSQIVNLQNQLNSLGTGTVDIIVSNPSAWVNKTAIVQGALGVPAFLPWETPLYNWLLVFDNGTNGIGVLWNGAVPNSSQVQIYGVVRQGLEELWYTNGTETVFYIEAETINPI